jgi:hypothetical protein
MFLYYQHGDKPDGFNITHWKPWELNHLHPIHGYFPRFQPEDDNDGSEIPPKPRGVDDELYHEFMSHLSDAFKKDRWTITGVWNSICITIVTLIIACYIYINGMDAYGAVVRHQDSLRIWYQ